MQVRLEWVGRINEECDRGKIMRDKQRKGEEKKRGIR